MSASPRPPGDPSSEFARSAGFAAAKGAGLVALAVVIGIVLLQVVDDGSTGPAVAEPSDETTPGTDPDGEEEPDVVDGPDVTAPAPTDPARSPEEVRVLVLNSGAPSGSAGAMADALSSVGYVNQPVQPGNDPERGRDGNAVMCREGFDREAETLAIAVGSGTEIIPFRDPPPPDAEEVDCVVLVAEVTEG